MKKMKQGHLFRSVPLFLFSLTTTVWAEDASSLEFFEKRIRPILVEHCYRCHSAQAKTPKGGLRLDSSVAIRKGGESGPVLIPRKPDQSLLIKTVRYAEDVPHMPPKGKLPEPILADLVHWIALGAPMPSEETAAPIQRNALDLQTARTHWAFQPLRPVQLPTVSDREWPRTAIDFFIRAKQEEQGLKPAAPVDRRTLIRRLSYDLIGLPPTPEEVEAFLQDESPDALAKVVDRLLASSHYGEHWGRHWLDVVRYADTAGDVADFPVPEAWRYRNYVLRAFNVDKPYDQFLREQIAGDILAASAPSNCFGELITATGYLAIARRFGFDPVADHYLTIEDTIDTLGKSILGLTLGCARCHDHKYDPIETTDYYGLYGIFDSTRYAFPGSEKEKQPRDMVPLTPPADLVRLNDPLKKQAAEKVEVAYAVTEGSPHHVRVQRRGDPNHLGEEVPRKFLRLFGNPLVPPNSGSGRLALAGWLTTGPAAALTARVMVNRIWQHHFGAGLVRTPNDFGIRGSPPSHPQLLEYLAQRFVEEGWSVKKMHRLIVLSATYQQSTEGSRQARDLDPGNVWLARFSRRRLSAEEIRDTILAVSGELDRTPGGAHPFPNQQTWDFTQHNPFTAVYDHNRRSVYLMIQRIKRHPFLGLFDGADPNASTGQRDHTTVPSQALFFLNDPFIHRQSACLAARLATLPNDAARLDRLSRLCYGRPPTREERHRAERFLADFGDPKQAWAAWVRVVLSSNEFLYLD